MKWKTIKLSCAMLTLALLIGLVPIFNNAAAQARPKVYVDPAENTFYTDVTSVGATFDVSIKSADWVEPGVYSYEFRLSYDKSMLEATAGAIPTGHWLTPTLSPGNIFPVDSGTINKDEGYVSFAVTLLGAEPGKTGGGTFATVTLKIIAAPPAGGSLSSSIAVTNLILADPTATQIPAANYDVVPATFEYAAPPPPWYLKVEPELVGVSEIGDEVTVNVKFYNATADAHIIGVEFKLTYPPILMAQSEWITEGDFFKSFGNTSFGGVPGLNLTHQYVQVYVLLVPPYPPANGYPSGDGILATIKFKATGLPTQITTYPLTLGDVIIVDDLTYGLPPLPYRRLEDGKLIAPAKLEDLNDDGEVNILDMAIFARAFGSVPDHPRWNPKADVDRNGKVNILDGVLIAKSFGWKAPTA